MAAKSIDFVRRTVQDSAVRWMTILSIALAAVLGLGLFLGSFSYFKTQEIEKASARLSLYRGTLEAELRHFAHLPFLLSQDPVVTRTLDGADATLLDHRLARFSQSASIDAIYLMDASGQTIAASNAKSPTSFKGQNYAFRPYFRQAQLGQLGEFYGIGATTGQPGYFYAISVQHPQARANGVIAIKVDLSSLQDNWSASGERILLANADGVVLLASNPDWRYKTLRPLTENQRGRILASRQFAQEPLDPLEWTVNLTNQTARIGEDRWLHVHTSNLPNSWSLHFFAPDDQAVARASLTTGAFMLLVLLALITWQIGRVRRIGAALQQSEREEAKLRVANERLAHEIEVRRDAERSLQKTQAELERAGRLAALGQLASSVTHELGQPIAAMRNQLAAAEMTAGPTVLNEKMQGLVARMESITRQLKFFSRKGRDKFEELDLRDVIEDALELLDPSVAQIGATLTFEPPGPAHMVMGNKLRLEQVVTNLVRNALDAVETTPLREVVLRIGKTDGSVWIDVTDTGHGLGDRSFDDLREPFATTRESGRGMGLGLTISAGIVTDHGGTITATNAASGGATFRVELPDAEETR